MNINVEVPLLGQPFTLLSGFPTLVITCACDAKSVILLAANNPGQCPGCKKVFQTTGAQFEGAKVAANVRSMTPQAPPTID